MNTKLATTLMISALLAPVAGYAAEKSTTQSAKEAVTDSVITTKIKAEYAKDKQVSAMRIKVDTDDKGVVTLSGNAKSNAEADQAVKIARDTKGVTSVRNNLVVGDTGGKKSMTGSATENVGDASITTKIKAAYVKDRLVRAKNIKVDTDDKGVVTLSGKAGSQAEADQADKLARETKGVTSVSNNIVVGDTSGKKSMTGSDKENVGNTSGKKSATASVKENIGDAVITAKIKAEYAKDKQVSAMRIKVDTDDKGVVTLSGNAKSKAESDQAEKIARDTKGVTSVRNDILVQAK